MRRLLRPTGPDRSMPSEDEDISSVNSCLIFLPLLCLLWFFLIPAQRSMDPLSCDCFFNMQIITLQDFGPRLFAGDQNKYAGRNIFGMFSRHRYHFSESIGETYETFLNVWGLLRVSKDTSYSLSSTNRILLILILLRMYYSYTPLSSIFDVSVSTVEDIRDVEYVSGDIIRTCLPIFNTKHDWYLKWPTINEWRSVVGECGGIKIAIRAIDGSSHRINRPLNENQ